MMTLQELKQRKMETGYTFKQIAGLSGVPLGTVQKIFNGETKAPRYRTMQALSALFETFHDFTREEKKQSEYTIGDIALLQGGVRRELINGTLFEMYSPSVAHQIIVQKLSYLFENYVTQKGGDCVVLPSPMDVTFPGDDKTLLEPDLMVVCDRSKLGKLRVTGAPDLVVEVLSSSTEYKDLSMKLVQYVSKGVREYWVVDLEGQHVVVYQPDREQQQAYPAVYGFQSEIPVRIWNGDCKVDFAAVWEQVGLHLR